MDESKQNKIKLVFVVESKIVWRSQLICPINNSFSMNDLLFCVSALLTSINRAYITSGVEIFVCLFYCCMS